MSQTFVFTCLNISLRHYSSTECRFVNIESIDPPERLTKHLLSDMSKKTKYICYLVLFIISVSLLVLVGRFSVKSFTLHVINFPSNL